MNEKNSILITTYHQQENCNKAEDILSDGTTAKS